LAIRYTFTKVVKKEVISAKVNLICPEYCQQRCAIGAPVKIKK
jgi:hypothetical protein